MATRKEVWVDKFTGRDFDSKEAAENFENIYLFYQNNRSAYDPLTPVKVSMVFQLLDEGWEIKRRKEQP